VSEDTKGELVLYESEDGLTQVYCRFADDSVWLSINQLAELFGRDKSVISRHLKSIYEDEELSRAATVAEYATVQTEGNRRVERSIDYYNLDAILAVGYRVRSPRRSSSPGPIREGRTWRLQAGRASASAVAKQRKPPACLQRPPDPRWRRFRELR
jgi:hypothetical protein